MTDKKKKKNDFRNRRRQNFFTVLFFVWSVGSLSWLWWAFNAYKQSCASEMPLSAVHVVGYSGLFAEYNRNILLPDDPIFVLVAALMTGYFVVFKAQRCLLGLMYVGLTPFFIIPVLLAPVFCNQQFIHVDTIEFDNGVYHLANYNHTNADWIDQAQTILYVCNQTGDVCEARVIEYWWSPFEFEGQPLHLTFTIDETCDQLLLHNHDYLLHVVDGSQLSSEDRSDLGCAIP